MQVNQVLPGESEKGFKLLKRIIKIFLMHFTNTVVAKQYYKNEENHIHHSLLVSHKRQSKDLFFMSKGLKLPEIILLLIDFLLPFPCLLRNAATSDEN